MFFDIQAVHSGRQSWKALHVYVFLLFKMRMQKEIKGICYYVYFSAAQEIKVFQKMKYHERQKQTTYLQIKKISVTGYFNFFRVSSVHLFQLNTKRKREVKVFLMSALNSVINRRDNLLFTQLIYILARAT